MPTSIRCTAALIALTLALTAAPTHAQTADRWLVLGSGEPTLALDTTTITKSISGSPRAWVRLSYTKPQRTADNKPYVKELWRVDINCAKRQISLVSMIDYGADGDVVSNHPEVMGIKWDEVAPETIGERTVNAFCKSRFGRS